MNKKYYIIDVSNDKDVMFEIHHGIFTILYEDELDDIKNKFQIFSSYDKKKYNCEDFVIHHPIMREIEFRFPYKLFLQLLNNNLKEITKTEFDNLKKFKAYGVDLVGSVNTFYGFYKKNSNNRLKNK